MIDKRAVYVESEHTVSFSIDRTPTFSGIIKPNEQNFTTQEIIKVETISLNDVFKLLNLEEITYLSIDTEGTELEILNASNFDKYRFRVITVEHNGDLEKALRIHKLLARNGYIRKLNIFQALTSFIYLILQHFVNPVNY